MQNSTRARASAITQVKRAAALMKEVKNIREFRKILKRLNGVLGHAIKARTFINTDTTTYHMHTLIRKEDIRQMYKPLLKIIATHLFGVHYRFKSAFTHTDDKPIYTMTLMGPKLEIELCAAIIHFLLDACEETTYMLKERHRLDSRKMRKRARSGKAPKKEVTHTKRFASATRHQLWKIIELTIYTHLEKIENASPQNRIKNYFILKDTKTYLESRYGKVQS